MLRGGFVVFMFFFSGTLFAQLFGGYYSPPLDIPLEMAGNYCELRSNHFHSGIDFRTNKQEGYPVYAVAEGFISRIKVSPFGYGNALYIDHPNGTTSVYGHLRNFDTLIQVWVSEQQYSKKSFEVDLFPPKSQFPVKQCDRMAWSGNTGGSEGPHLHFEIRDTKSEEPLDPIDFGFLIPDVVPPEIEAILGFIENKEGGADTLRIWKRSKKSKSGDTVRVKGPLHFLAELSDHESLSGSKNAVKSYGLIINNDSAFSCTFNRFPFHHSRMVNAHIDYRRFKKTGRRFQRYFKLPGQKLNFYRQSPGLLPLQADSGAFVPCTWFVTDAAGLKTELKLILYFTQTTSDTLVNSIDSLEALNPAKLIWNRSNDIITPNFKVNFPEYAVYENTTLRTSWIKSTNKSHISGIAKVHDDVVPLDKAFTIAIKKPANPDVKAPKTAIYRLGKNQTGGSFIETKQVGDYLVGSSRVFGEFVLMSDWEAPQITKAEITVALEDSLRLRPMRWKIKDNRSGIGNIELLLDGQWLLAAYDAKNQIVSYYPDKYMLPEKKARMLQLSISDQAGNKKVWRKKITY